MRAFLYIGFLLPFIINSNIVEAQVYGSNVFEFQYGNLPNEENRNYTTSYNQLNLFYDSDKISFYGKLEQFLTPNKELDYLELTQKRFQYQDDNFRIRVGNFYETIGRGLLLRSYDIPGSIYEDAFQRKRYSFFRDLEGIAINANTEWLEIKALRAEPLFNILPPDFNPDSLRRPDLVEAIQANVFINEQLSIGGAFLRSNPSFSDQYQEYGSLMFTLSPISNIQFFSEYAFETNTNLLAFNEQDSYALYTGMNFYLDSFGGSFEYKNYNKFRLGQGYNDPPSLIKEHTYPILNRSTHVLETSSETGIQAEFYYNFDPGHSITVNYSTANNDLFKEFEYQEYFLEGYFVVDDYLSFKSFFDYANDDLKGEENRFSTGFITEKSYNYIWGIALDIQYQTFTRSFEPDPSKNYYGSFTFSYLPSFTAGLIFEASTDPQLTDNPKTFGVETDTRLWFGGNVSYKFNSRNRVDVFAGKRRGGPACTSGICYEILDFEGVEVRFSTRF
tara:strand:+ start:7770 stop:9278 length:1509 start_codon:yes stop_codon:yes gene_type:complete